MIVHNEDYALRLATLDDVDTIATLTDLAYSKYVPRIGRQPQPMTTDYRDYVQQHPVWLLEVSALPYAEGQQFAAEPQLENAQLVKAHNVVGVLALQEEVGTLLIYSVAIHPAYQRKGYGRLLLDWAERQARHQGYHTIRLYTNALMTENIALYTALGYRETGREQFGSNVRVNMSKQLP